MILFVSKLVENYDTTLCYSAYCLDPNQNTYSSRRNQLLLKSDHFFNIYMQSTFRKYHKSQQSTEVCVVISA